MHLALSSLEKNAIKYAMEENWEEAIKANEEILRLSPKSLDAKIRLGRSHLQLKNFTKASKLFKEVLAVDPINKLALKNIELVKKKRIDKNPTNGFGKSLVIEPGTTTKTDIQIICKGLTANAFTFGDRFSLHVEKYKVTILKDEKTLGIITDESVQKSVLNAKKQKIPVEAIFIKGNEKVITIMLRSTKPVFKGDKQDIKPYVKKGTIEEPEIEVESFDDE